MDDWNETVEARVEEEMRNDGPENIRFSYT